MVDESDIGEDHFVCQDCGWEGLFAKIDPDNSTLDTICPECESTSLEIRSK